MVKSLYSTEQILCRVKELAAQIHHDMGEKEMVALCILKGSFIFSSDLTRELSNDLRCEFLELKRQSEGSDELLRTELEPDSAIAGKDVLIIDDLVSGGSTLQTVQELVASRRPASVKTCVLLLKETKLKRRLKIDYLGFKVEDQLLVGYGLDQQGRYRELPYIGVIENGSGDQRVTA